MRINLNPLTELKNKKLWAGWFDNKEVPQIFVKFKNGSHNNFVTKFIITYKDNDFHLISTTKSQN